MTVGILGEVLFNQQLDTRRQFLYCNVKKQSRRFVPLVHERTDEMLYDDVREIVGQFAGNGARNRESVDARETRGNIAFLLVCLLHDIVDENGLTSLTGLLLPLCLFI